MRTFVAVLEGRLKAQLFFLAVCTLLCALYAAKAQDSTTADAERYIKESESMWAESAASGDASGLERFLADDLIGVDPDGSIYDKSKAIADTRLGPKEFVSNHLNYVNLRFHGNTVIAQGSESWVRRTGTPLRGKFVWIDTWMKRNDKWQIVSAVDVAVPESVR